MADWKNDASEALARRRVARARRLVASIQSQMTTIQKWIDAGAAMDNIPSASVGNDAARLHQTLCELDAMAELLEVVNAPDDPA